MCYLLIVKSGTRKARMVLAATIGFLVLFLIWTGSRTGLLMTLVAMGLLFRARIVRGAGIALICGIFFLAASMVFSQSTVGAGRLMSIEDTRSGRWLSLAEEFLSSPLVGVVFEDVYIQENSYLSAAARFGVVGLVLLFVVGVLVAFSIITVFRDRRELGEHVLLADLVMAGLVSLAVGANFEGICLAR